MRPAHQKVLFVITKSNWGGAQKYVYDLATNLPKESFSITVALGGTGEAAAPPGLLAKRLAEAGVRTVFLASLARDIHLPQECASFLELLRVIGEERPDVLHLNSSKVGALGALAGRMRGVPRIVFTAHGWAHREPRPWHERVLIWLTSWITILLAHRVIAVSHYDYHDAPVLFSRRKIAVIHNGIDLHPTLGSGERVRSAFPPGVQITGTIGDLSKNKNHISLVEQARANPHLYVAIVGSEGPERGHLEAKIREYRLEERVKIFGFIPANEVLRGFDVFALPSLKEGLPYVLLEARIAGLPIVANRVGGVGEVLDAEDISDFSLDRMIEKTSVVYR
jgi:glycosyltransferase involved in cell wall biosynthesis